MVRGGAAVWLLWLIKSRDGMVRPKDVRGSDARMTESKTVLSRYMLLSLTRATKCDQSLQ